MSTPEKEIELVAGTIGGITQKKADTWTVAVTPEGSQYAKNLWTKDADLVESLSAKIGQSGSFVCEASYWERDGKQIRSLWVQASGPEGEEVSNVTVNPPGSVATPAAAPRESVPLVKTSNDVMTKEEWARKDSAIHKMACIKTAVEALKHTMPSDPTEEDLNRFAERVFVLTYRWHANVIAERDDPTGEGVPF